VHENQLVLAGLAKPPGSRVVARKTTPVRDRRTRRVVGYATLWSLTVPRRLSRAAIEAFYRRRLAPRWRYVGRIAGPVLSFRRAGRRLSVNLAEVPDHRFGLAVVRVADRRGGG
jgi:hypothetical protein